MRYLAVLCLISLLTGGCAHTAVVNAWEPAEIDVTRLNRVVVVTFSGEEGASVATTLANCLWENRFYSVVDRSEISGLVLPASFADGQTPEVHDLLGPARQRGIDGVLLGEVIEYRCEDKETRTPALKFSKKLADEDEDRGFSTGLGLQMQNILTREGKVTIAFRLVDVRTGEIRASREISHEYEGKMVNGEGELPTQEEVLHQLTRQCLQDIVEMLAPHQTTVPLRLATCDAWVRARREVKLGVRYAEEGDWEKAERKWQEALEINPQNAAALFNLAVLTAHRQQYGEAEELAMQALRIQHKDIYAEGLETIRSHRNAFEKAEEQREARIITAGEECWR